MTAANNWIVEIFMSLLAVVARFFAPAPVGQPLESVMVGALLDTVGMDEARSRLSIKPEPAKVLPKAVEPPKPSPVTRTKLPEGG